MDEKRVFLARHGQTFHNAAGGQSYIDADHLAGELAGDDRERAEAHVGLYPEWAACSPVCGQRSPH